MDADVQQKKPDTPTYAKTHAPWSETEVAALNFFQANEYKYPYLSDDGEVLIATPEGFRVRKDGEVVQTWAHTCVIEESLSDSSFSKELRSIAAEEQ